jgi:hypothetical protein
MEAGKQSTTGVRVDGRRRTRFYTPAAEIRMVPGLELCKDYCVRRALITDTYRGAADAIVDSGLLPRHLLPGQPGLPSTCAAYRPDGATEDNQPGHLSVYRNQIGGTFRVELRVSHEEEDRRRAEHEQRELEERNRHKLNALRSIEADCGWTDEAAGAENLRAATIHDLGAARQFAAQRVQPITAAGVATVLPFRPRKASAAYCE